jgi:hypothetical protein
MNTSKAWFAVVLVLTGVLGACSSDDGPQDEVGSAAGASAGGGASSGSAASGGAGASGASGSGDPSGPPADPNQPAAPGVPPTFIPNFPGAGTSGDDAPLTNGMLCDYVPLNGAPTPAEITTCFFSGSNPDPAATMEQVLECVDGADVVHIRLTFSPTFADNTYGANAIGWSREERAMNADPAVMPRKGRGANGHSFEDLVGSDHAEIQLTNDDGDVVVQFKLDYITEDASAPSGYASLGVTGGEGEMIVGEAAWILHHQTSIETNLNERGYSSYTVDSPATDKDYTVNPDAPEWDFRVVYEAWIDVAAFGNVGFGTALIDSVHASPSKAQNNTLIVEPGECPPCDPNAPDAQCDPGDPPPDECDPSQPDAECDPGNPPDEPPSDGVCDPTMVDVDCGDAGAPPTDDPMYCLDNPTDPLCHVD